LIDRELNDRFDVWMRGDSNRDVGTKLAQVAKDAISRQLD
jgi:hypothetical protein